MIDAEWLRAFCKKLPHTTEKVQWGADLCFKVAGKIYCVVVLEPAPVCLSFKCTPEEFAELIEISGVIPAPYMARNHWVALETENALPPAEIKRRVQRSYDLVFEKLPKKVQAGLRPPAKATAKKSARRT